MPPDLNIAEIRYASGAVHFRYARVLASDGTRWLRHGLFVEYAESGSVLSEGQYHQGKEHGIWKDFHVNGQITAQGEYRDGVEVGIWRYCSEVGDEEPSERVRPNPSFEARPNGKPPGPGR